MEEINYRIIHLKGEAKLLESETSILELKAEDTHTFWIDPISQYLVADVNNQGRSIQWTIRDQKGKELTHMSKKTSWIYLYSITFSKQVCGSYIYTLEASFTENKTKRKITPPLVKIKGYSPPLITKVKCYLPNNIRDLGDFIRINMKAEGLNGVKLYCEAKLDKLKLNASNVCVDGNVSFDLEIDKIALYMLGERKCSLTIRVKDPSGTYIKDSSGNDIVLQKN